MQVAPDSEHAFRVASTIAVVSGTSYISSASHVAKSASTIVVASGTSYISSASHVAKATLALAGDLMPNTAWKVDLDQVALALEGVTATAVALALDGVTSTAVTDTTSTYTIAYEDFSVAERAHARSQRFFCDQAVGKPPAPVGDPSSEWITMPFVKTFAFRAVPLVCSVATLKIEAQTESDDDLLYAGRNLTVVGENSEILGYMFHDSAAFVGLNEGFQLHDTITFSAEKMMEMSADGEVVFTLRTDPTVTGGLKFRMMTLSFSPTACFSSVAATDEYVEINDRDPTIKSIYYNLTIYTPPTLMGAPASDAIVTVTADADLADGYLELSYGTEKVRSSLPPT
ncbi:hypothetical protein T484DRAFT_1813961 [Baffinella frigidus]|nr:hypothetical protein T484DRAFT_1813961 [Cryptophyta sp. CCMP2293]